MNSVRITWDGRNLDHSIIKVWLWLIPLLCNIMEANRENNFVESQHGEEHTNIETEDIIKEWDDITIQDILDDNINSSSYKGLYLQYDRAHIFEWIKFETKKKVKN